MKFLIALVLAMLVTASHAAVTTYWDPNGANVPVAQIISGTTSNGVKWEFNTHTGQWAPPVGPGNVARVTVGRQLAIGAAEGAAVAGTVAVTAASEFTAASLALGAIKLAKGGVAGVVVGVALDLALQQAHLSFDSVQNSMVYNPPAIPPGTPQTIKYFEYCGPNMECGPSTNLHTYDAGVACTGTGQRLYGNRFAGAVAVGGNSADHCDVTVAGDPGATPVPPPSHTYPGLSWTNVQTSSTEPLCPNGVLFSNVTKCKQPVVDGVAQDYLTPQINTGNGPVIGQNTQGGNGALQQPTTGVDPSGNPLAVDHSSWPQVSGPPSSQFGPQSTTSTSDSTTTQSNGQPGAPATTTTTSTNTTNTTNTYNNNVSNVSVQNTTTKVVCDPAGVCTNTTTHSTPADSTTPGDQEQVKPCGLPGTPACKIDETGTPTVATGLQDQKAGNDALDKATDDTKANITAVADPATKDTAWKFSFAFPTNCAPLVAWDGMSFDICRFQPMIHDILSMLWYGSTVFLVVGMVGRTMRGEGA